jgi:hypothetical protein
MAMIGDSRLPRRFWSKVRVAASTGCWMWTASKNRKGYGRLIVGSRTDNSQRTVQAHRWAYEVLVGAVPVGLQLDHLCRNRACVNPCHLEPVTCRENVRRGNTGGHLRDRTHCPAGHEYTDENTYLAPGRRHRRCRICHRASWQGARS